MQIGVASGFTLIVTTFARTLLVLYIFVLLKRINWYKMVLENYR